MRETAWLLINPGSSRADSAPRLRGAAAAYAGLVCHETEDAADMRRQIASAVAEGVGRVVVAGGDGTIHLAVNALLASRGEGEPGAEGAALPVLGIVPLGTANDLAKSLGLPMRPEAALEVALGEAVRAIDVLRLDRGDGQVCYAVNAVTGGLSVEIHEQLDDEVKKWWGGFAYAKAMFEVLGDAPEQDVTVDAGGVSWRGDAFGLVVANGPRAGGQTLVPVAAADDGQAEAVLVCAPAGGERLKLLAEFAAGVHLDSPRVRWERAGRIEVRAQPPMPLIADGERCGQTPVRIDVLCGAVRVAGESSADRSG
ncbi:MAG: diacylglycerol/lipid kinase family protein [Phycisphaerales bacterium JB063]